MHRRRFLSRFGTAAAAGLVATPALTRDRTPDVSLTDLRGAVSSIEFDVRPGAVDDQSAVFQAMIDAAAARAIPVFLPAGVYVISNIKLAEGTGLHGVPGATRLVYGGNGHFVSGANLDRCNLTGLTLDGANGILGHGAEGLADLRGVRQAVIEDTRIIGSAGHGIYLERCGGRITDSTITGATRFGVHAVESTGLTIRDNVLRACADGGIVIHRWSKGRDGTIIAHNRIEDIGAASGGTGQWGNAINVFRADDVLVTGNIIDRAAFSAIRANSASNIQITDNTCRASGETAIYSEFAFENAVVAGNIIDGGTLGISITNFDHGGRAATVSGNIVRNIIGDGPYRADPPGFGIGISVQADTTVNGNVIDGVALYGINVGWGPHLRDCVVSANVIRNADVGVAFSEVDGAGAVLISANAINARNGAIRAHRWADITTGDLLGADRRVPGNAILAGNRTV